MAIFDHMGKESSFLPSEMKSCSSPNGPGKESCFLLPRNASFSPKCNTTLPHKSSPSICREGFSPSSKYKIPSNPSLQILFYIFIFHFYFYCNLFFLNFSFLYYYYFLWNFFPHKTWNSSPNWKNYSPAFEANDRRIDAPGLFLCQDISKRFQYSKKFATLHDFQVQPVVPHFDKLVWN